ASSAVTTARVTRCTASNNSGKSEVGRSVSVSTCARGTTSVWPLKTGRWSRNARTFGSSSTISAATAPPTIEQNRQSTGCSRRASGGDGFAVQDAEDVGDHDPTHRRGDEQPDAAGEQPDEQDHEGDDQDDDDRSGVRLHEIEARLQRVHGRHVAVDHVQAV